MSMCTTVSVRNKIIQGYYNIIINTYLEQSLTEVTNVIYVVPGSNKVLNVILHRNSLPTLPYGLH